MELANDVIGLRLDGRYHLRKRIGDGGFGVVFEATDEEDGSTVAVKVMALGPDHDRAAARSVREARLANVVDHPNIVEVLDAGTHATPPLSFIVMERLFGENLGVMSERLGPLGLEETAWIGSQICQALAAAHDNGVIHRDLKPTNLFITWRRRRPEVKVLDFGTAKLVEDTMSAETTQALGTPIYMAPEQFTGEAPTHAVDIFGLALSVFRLLTGEHYYALESGQSSNAFALGARLMHGVPEGACARAKRYGRAVPDEFDDWFEQCTRRDPATRFASAEHARVALLKALDVEPSWSSFEPLDDLPEETPSVPVVAQDDADSEPDSTSPSSTDPEEVPLEPPRSAARMGALLAAMALVVAAFTWPDDAAVARPQLWPLSALTAPVLSATTTPDSQESPPPASATTTGSASPTTSAPQTAPPPRPASRQSGTESPADRPPPRDASPAPASKPAPTPKADTLWTRE